MILPDHRIVSLLKSGSLAIDPHPDDDQIQPASIDLKLGRDFMIMAPSDEPIDVRRGLEADAMVQLSITDMGHIDLVPGAFMLATTAEKVRIPVDHVARVEGKSSLGRIGLTAHVTAGFIDPGYHGFITLELANLGARAIRLRPGMKICQLSIDVMADAPDRSYGHPELKSRYQGQTGVVGSRIGMEVQ